MRIEGIFSRGKIIKALDEQGYTVRTRKHKGNPTEDICLKKGQKLWRVIHLNKAVEKRDVAAARALASALSDEGSSITEMDLRAIESFHKKHFKKSTIYRMQPENFENMPEAVRLLDAHIFAHKLYPKDRSVEAVALASHLASTPKLHYFLRCQHYHTVLSALRGRENAIHEGRSDWTVPELRIKDEKVELPVVVNGQRKWVAWQDFEKRLTYKEEELGEDKDILLGTEGDFRGVMMDGWITYQGIDIKPKKAMEKANELIKDSPLDKEIFLNLLQSGFVEADIVANKEELEDPVLSVMADSTLGRPKTRGVHGLFMISVPDGDKLHRFVMSAERARYSFATHRGRATLLDIRHYKTFSGNRELVHADFLLTEDKLGNVWKALMEFRAEASVYGQMQHNCCTVVRALAESADIQIDPKMHTLGYISPKLAPKEGTWREKGLSRLVNFLLYFKTDAKKTEIPEEAAHFAKLKEIKKAEKAYIHSPFQVAKKCDEIVRYRQSFGDRFEKEVGKKLGKEYQFLFNKKVKRPRRFSKRDEKIMRVDMETLRAKIDKNARFLAIPDWAAKKERQEVAKKQAKKLEREIIVRANRLAETIKLV